jgi:hypothetical protein
MKIRDILLEDVRTHEPDFKPAVGVEWINLDYTLTREEEMMLKQNGISPSDVKSVDGLIPIVYSHTLKMKGNDGLMDAIKMRSSSDVMDREQLQIAIDRAVRLSITTKLAGKKFARENKIKGLEWFQNILKYVKDAIIVPIPSSSPLTRMIADSLSRESGFPVIDIFYKNKFPELSSSVKTVERGYEDRVTRVAHQSPADKKRAWDSEIAALTTELQQLEAGPQRSSGDEDRAGMLRIRIGEIKDKIAKAKFEKKSSMHPLDRARGYYGYIEPTEAGQQVHKKVVIVVDDNIVTNETMAEAIKSLLRNRIVPTVMVGFAMHQYS